MEARALAARLTEPVGRVVARLGGEIAALADDEMLALLADATDARRTLDLIVAACSAEVEHRSARERGYDGLAQRQGVRTGTALVQQITGQTRREVTRAVRAGQELAPSTAAPAPWLLRLRRALADGVVSQAQFDAVRGGLGEPPSAHDGQDDAGCLDEAWDRTVVLLIHEAATRTVEDLRDQARIARDRLDPIGVTLRFEQRFAARSFRRWTDDTGQQHARIVFDDEAAAWVDAILRAALRPRRGPRFVEARQGVAHDEHSDDRTTEQLQYDTILGVLRTGAAADPGQAFGDRQPGVRIVLDAAAISAAGERGSARVTGVGHLEDGGQALPPGVVEKYLCDAGATTVSLDPLGRPLDVGREHRLFTRAQRIAIAVRDGGCMSPGCDRAAVRVRISPSRPLVGASRQDRRRRRHPAVPQLPSAAAQPGRPHQSRTRPDHRTRHLLADASVRSLVRRRAGPDPTDDEVPASVHGGMKMSRVSADPRAAPVHGRAHMSHVAALSRATPDVGRVSRPAGRARRRRSCATSSSGSSRSRARQRRRAPTTRRTRRRTARAP